ncbi:MAG TPA: hypothetical protein PKI03_27330 [Pseudomonadota bacterium]|nr:hypothetical protein [Pseudomonadota bacterium]
MEDALIQEFAALAQRGVIPPLGENGDASVTVAGRVVGAALNAYGQFFSGAQSTASFLLAADGGRLVGAVCQGNEKHTSTMVAGAIALSEIYQHTLGSGRSSDLGADVRRGFERAHHRIREINLRDVPLRRWTFASCFTSTVKDLRGIGCSVTALAVEGTAAAVAHIGEGRALRQRAGRLERLTADHTLGGQPEYLAKGSRELAEFHAEVVLKLLGYTEKADVDYQALMVQPGDLFILAGSLIRTVDVPAVLRQQSAADLTALCRTLQLRTPLKERPALSATYVAVKPLP